MTVVLDLDKKRNEKNFENILNELYNFEDVMFFFPDKYKLIPGALNRIVVNGDDYSDVIKILVKYIPNSMKFLNSHILYYREFNEYHLGLPDLK